MIAPSKNFTLLFIAAGLLMMSLFFLTSSPFSISNLILGVIPLLFLVSFGIAIWRARKKDKESGGEGG